MVVRRACEKATSAKRKPSLPMNRRVESWYDDLVPADHCSRRRQLDHITPIAIDDDARFFLAVLGLKATGAAILAAAGLAMGIAGGADELAPWLAVVAGVA